MPLSAGIDLNFALGANNPNFTADIRDIREKMASCLVNSIGRLAAVAWLSIVCEMEQIGRLPQPSVHMKLRGPLYNHWQMQQNELCDNIFDLDFWAVPGIRK